MYMLLWIFIGLIAGWLAGRSLEGEGGYGPSLDIAMGVGGALIGGILMRSNGFTGYGGTLLATLVAMTCAVMLTTLAGISNGRKAFARHP
jgi:uncharacterized membrane protein YeaQ/YmgE (transglycosylase-associated protein family)